MTLVVSPLIALMKDQVDALSACQIPAAFINSTLTPDEQADRLQRMAAGEYRLVYVVPERFRSPRFIEAVKASKSACWQSTRRIASASGGMTFGPTMPSSGAGYAPDPADQTDGESLRDQYFDNLELMGHDNPCYLGELRFNGLAYFEWKYIGDRLSRREVWQVVDLLQNCLRTYI